MMQVVEIPLGPNGVAGYAIDVEDQEQARAELNRFVRAQRDMLDRLSAGVAQFGRDRSLIFFNQPFARLFSLTAEFLADRPGVRPADRRDARGGQSARGARLPGLEGGAPRLVHQRPRRRRGGLAAARRQASARRRPAAARRRPAHHLRGPDRADPARLGARHPAAGAHRHLRQSVRGGRRVRRRTAGSTCGTTASRSSGASRRSSSPATRASTRWRRIFRRS